RPVDGHGEWEDHHLQRGHPRQCMAWRAARLVTGFTSARTRPGVGGHDRRDGWRSFGIELEDVAAIDPEPEERLLRFSVAAESRFARRAVERLRHAGQRIAHVVARLRTALLDDLPQDRRAVV